MSLLINAADFLRDRIPVQAEITINLKVISFREQFFAFGPELANPVKGLNYPAPNPELPLLGFHLTEIIGGASAQDQMQSLHWRGKDTHGVQYM